MVWERRHYWTEIAAFATAARRGAARRRDAGRQRWLLTELTGLHQRNSRDSATMLPGRRASGGIVPLTPLSWHQAKWMRVGNWQ